MQKTVLSARGLTVKRIQYKQQNVIHEICLCFLIKWIILRSRDMSFLSLKEDWRKM